MRKTLFTLAFATLGFGGLQAQSSAETNTTAENVLIEVTSETSRDDLAELQKSLESQGIFFRYDQIEWTNGALQTIRMAVKCTDGTMKVSEVMSVTPGTPTRFGVTYVQGKPQICFGKECE